MSLNVEALGDVVDVFSGYAWKASDFKKSEPGLPIIRIQNVGNDKSGFVYWDNAYADRFLITEGDILLSLSGSFRVARWQGPHALLNQRVVKLTPCSDLDAGYFLHFMGGKLREIEAMGRHALVNNVSVGDLKKIAIPLPPLSEQRRIAAMLDKADALRAKRREAIAKCDQLLQSVFLDMFGDPVTNPKGWPLLPLQDVVTDSTCNGAYYPKDAYVESGGTPMVHMSDAFYGVVGPRGLKRVIAPGKDVLKYTLTDADLLVSRRSLTYEGAAKPCRVSSEGEPLIFESSMIRITPLADMVTTEYLYHYLSNERARSQHLLKHVTRSTISGINQKSLKQVGILVPPLDLQRRFDRAVTVIRGQLLRLEKTESTFDQLFTSIQTQAFSGQLSQAA